MADRLDGEASQKGRALAGGGNRVVGHAQQAVAVEGAAARDTTATAGEVAAWLFSPRGAQELNLAHLEAAIAQDENLVWLDLCAFNAAQLRDLAPSLHLTRGEIHAALSPWQRPRLDLHGDHFFVSATVARLDGNRRRVLAGELDLIVGRNFLLSLHRLPLPFGQRVLDRARVSPELVQLDSAYLLYIILDELLAYYETIFEEVRDAIERMEERALTDTSEGFLEDLLEVKRYVAALAQLAEQHRQVFAAFLRPDFRFVNGEEVEVYYRDLDVRLARLIDLLGSAQDTVNGAFDIYVSHVAHRTNQIIKVLTVVSAVLLPVTLIVTFFGTTFRGVPIYNTTGFAAMLVAIAAAAGTTLYLFHRQGWL